MKIVARVFLGLAAAWALLFATVLWAMSQRPVVFGKFMKYAPAPLVWGALPAKDMWLHARRGTLRVGDPAPDFTLPRRDRTEDVTLSKYQHVRPVVLVFGSYT